MNVVVVGGGVVGCSVAYFLAKRGARVTLLDRGRIGREASFAAAGILGAQSEMHGASERARRDFIRARTLVAPWVRELETLSGIRVGYRRSGALHVALTEAEATALRSEATAQEVLGLKCDVVDAAACREIEPGLAGDVALGVHIADDGTLDPRKLMLALVAALSLFDVDIREGAAVTDVLVEGERAVGVTVGSDVIRADAVILAAGAWSSSLPAVRRYEPNLVVEPVRGQIVLLREPVAAPAIPLRGVVFGAGGYLVARGDGDVLVGSTEERVGFTQGPTAAGVAMLLARAARLAPALAQARFVEAWAGLRPALVDPSAASDNVARVGASALPALFLATGHFRNGILLACQSGRDVADEVFPAPARESVRISVPPPAPTTSTSGKRTDGDT